MEKRNIEISLEKAKEWYKQGGDLREIALQAFSEDELNDKYPTRWGEYKTNANYKYNRIDAGDLTGSASYCHFATKVEAEAFVALGKLIQLRDEYWKLDNNWKPDWDDHTEKYCINCSGSRIFYETWRHYNKILAFRTSELRNKFNENFKDLIEEASMFL